MSAVERRLRDPERFRSSVRSFQWLGAAASGATDLDCLIERHGHFLVLEGKTWHAGLTVPLGQHIALSHLASIESFTVYLVGETHAEDDDSEQRYFTMRYGVHPLHTNRRGAYFPAVLFTERTRDEMRALVADWVAAR